MLSSEERKQLEKSIEEITEIAAKCGLDFYPMRYEICPADIIYTFGAYGMPTRFSHWSFGKAFHKMKTQYDLGLSKIYELVINSNPCYAFLLEGNSLVQNKLIVAHVLAHCDFFKNNARFQQTNRDMVESMSAAAERIRQYEIEYGVDRVEAFLDAVLSIQEHIDPSLIHPRRKQVRKRQTESAADSRPQPGPYDDLWSLDHQQQQEETEQPLFDIEKFPKQPEKDLLLFIEEHSNVLKEWQRDILTIMRNEMLYFWPQIETKIMNEGWASYWHIRIMRELDLTSDETIEFAKLNAGVVQSHQHNLNPYYLGLKIFEDIEKRFGREKMFEVRETDADISFLRNYLTKELIEELDLYVFEKQGPEWKITDKTWENVREQLVFSKVNGGFPYLQVTDGNYQQQGELFIQHAYEGIELDLRYIERTLPFVYRLWGKSVHIKTVVEKKPVQFTYDGAKCHRKFIS
ncbi:SpoVR family protein [Marinicrinis sediminis]|uniref:SpoVR family protein n=1 Tax=Marinicrinis sediminis TaxID=1652465 RepID=A0ABW5R8S1_9BACL